MSYVTLSAAKLYLNISPVQPTYDAELQLFIDAAEGAIVEEIGPVSPTAAIETYDGGSCFIRLLENPVTAITSVTESNGTYVRTLTAQPVDGTTFDAYGYTVDLREGLLTRRVSGVASPFMPGRRNITVTYTAGWATIPANVIQATKELIRFLWETQRGGTRKPGTGSDGQPITVEMPARVRQLLSPYTQVGIG